MEFTAVGTSIDVDTIIDASDSDVSQDGDTEVSEDKCRAVLVASIGTTRVRRDYQASRRLCGENDAVFACLQR